MRIPAPIAARYRRHLTFYCQPRCGIVLLSALIAVLDMPSAWAAQAAPHASGGTLLAQAGSGAMHQADRRAYHIPPGRLGDVLAQFAAQAGVPLSFDAAALQHNLSNGLQGHYSVQEGFTALLHGTAYQAIAGAHGYALHRRATDTSAARLAPVTVRGKADIKDLPYQSAASISVKTRDDIERFRGTSVGDIFQGMPGVLIGENRNSGAVDVNIRGMQGQGRVPVLIDGSRQETTVYRGYAGVASRSYLDPDLIGGMTVEKGPSMSAQGTGATGGLVSMRTLDADDILKPGADTGMRVRITAIGNSSPAPEPGTYAGYFVERPSYNSNCRFPSYCQPGMTMPGSFAPDNGMHRPGLLNAQSWAGSMAVAKRLDAVDLIAAYAQRRQGNYYAGTKGPTPEIALGEPLKLPWYTETPVSMEGASRFRAGERIPNTQYESQSLLLKSRIYISDAHELTLSYLRYHSEFGEMMPSQIIGFGQSRQWLPSTITAQTTAARYQLRPADNPWIDLRANAWHTRTDSAINTPDIYSIDIANNTHRDERYLRSGLDISNTVKIAVLGEMRLETGAALQVERMNTDTDKNGGFYGGARAGKRREASLFANLQWQPIQSLTFTAGLRQTWFRSEDDNALPIHEDSAFCQDADGDGQCDPMYYKNRKQGMAPVFSLMWQPRDDLQFYARHAEALRMPSLFETTSGWSVSPALDIDLNPEHAKNREIGVNYLKDDAFRNDDKLRLKAAVFRNHITDYLTRTPPNLYEDNQMANPSVTGDFFRIRNIQSATFQGYELSGSYDAGVAFGEFGITRYTKIEVCHVGSYRRYFCNDYGVPQSYINNMIPPKWHGSLMLGTRLLQRKLTVGARATFMGKRSEVPQYNSQTGFNRPIPWHRYTLVDLFASYQVNDALRLDFNVDNLTDRYYLDALSLGMVPAPGRTARLSLTMQF